jgi:hypothetical protein
LRIAVKRGYEVDETAASSRMLASESLLRVSELGQALHSDAYDALVGSLITELSRIPKLRISSPANEDSGHNFRHIQSCLGIAATFLARQTASHTMEHAGDQGTLLALLAQYVSLWPSQLVSHETSPGAFCSHA